MSNKASAVSNGYRCASQPRSSATAQQLKLAYSMVHRTPWYIDGVRIDCILRQWTDIYWYPALCITQLSSTKQRCSVKAELERFAKAPWYIALPSTAIAQFVWRLLFLLILRLGRDGDIFIQHVFIILVQTRQETRQTCPTAAFVRPPARTFFLHPVNGVGDVECFFK